jgi:hypothetical protein
MAVNTELYFARFNEYARAEDGVGRSRIDSCRHRHATIADARSCDRTDLTDLGEFSADECQGRRKVPHFGRRKNPHPMRKECC